MADLDLSVACSFQLVLVTDASIRSAPKAKHHALTIVEEALSQNVEATCVTCQKAHKFNIEINTTANPTPLQWSLQADKSAVLVDDERYAPSCQFHGLKLTTPTFRTNAIYSTSPDDDGHVHQLDYSGIIKAVLQHAQRSLGTLSSPTTPQSWLYAPSHCKMSVNIDNTGPGFLDSTYEKVAQLTKTCARQIDILHMGRAHDSTLTSSSTITFPQSPSTLSPTQALSWIAFCLSAVQSCADPDLDLDLAHFASPTFSASDLLQALGMTQSVFASLMADHRTRCRDAIANAMLGMSSSGSRIAEFALTWANRELKDMDSDVVLARVKVKLLDGVYGRFSDSYLGVALLCLNTDM
ncbi:hypothetical protein AC578_6512 [Pseudocercospora eumusae]|uniref:Uncharacterized protein n=1 Tax=Pseudocercospora eumusae TaxID=321146 RepID=A0A139HHP0_9PEZI|nr:hypothetical protein AC578_6512 [Pseudocercospora eumusae]